MTSPLPRRAASAGLRMQSGGLSAEQALRLALKRSLEDMPAAAAAPPSSSSSSSSSSSAPAPAPAVAAAAQKKPRKAGSSSAPAMDASANVARLARENEMLREKLRSAEARIAAARAALS